MTNRSVQYSFKEKVSLINDIYNSFKYGNTDGVIKYAETELMFVAKEAKKNKEAIPDDKKKCDEMLVEKRFN